MLLNRRLQFTHLRTEYLTTFHQSLWTTYFLERSNQSRVLPVGVDGQRVLYMYLRSGFCTINVDFVSR